MAFFVLRSQIEDFHLNEKKLKKMNVELSDWLEWDAKTREMKLEFAGTLTD